MNPAEFTIKNRFLSVIIIVLISIGGLLAYQNMPRFEDPEFTIRTAQIVTQYPGATPSQVMDEVTEKLESTIQQMQEVEEIRSTSSDGLSIIEVDIEYAFSTNKSDLQLIWTKLRNKVSDTISDLPSGATTPVVNDDFGDVYGLYYLLTGDGYSEKEIYDYAKRLRKDLLAVEGVGKVNIVGNQTEVIYLEIARERAASLGVSLQQLYATLAAQNTVQYSGSITLDGRRVVFQPSGTIDSVDAIKNLKIALNGTADFTTIGEIANVRRDYLDPPNFLIRYDGHPALALGISNVSGVNVVEMGNKVDAKLREVESERPLGIELHENYHQGKAVQRAVSDFASNVFAALVIVLITLLIFMGFRSALIIGAVLILTILATLATMNILNIPMHRISLGALIIALGMLVDNAIVVTEGILVGTQQGGKRLETAKKIVSQTKWPLLGGTIVGILAFAPIGFAAGATAEYTGDLFWVIMISLGFSWIFALTLAPLFAYWLFRENKNLGSPTPSRFRKTYGNFMDKVLRARWLVMSIALIAFGSSIWGFRYVKSGFFPASTTSQLVIDFWLPQGTDIKVTQEQLLQLEDYVASLEGVENVQTLIGGGTLRYMLIYQFENQNSAYGQILIKTENYEAVAPLLPKIQSYVDQSFIDAQAKVWRFSMGPGGGSKVEAEFSGPDPAILRDLASQAKNIMMQDPNAIFIKDNWRQPIPVVVPIFAEEKARRVSVTREDLSNSLSTNFDGRVIGVYREEDTNLYIIERAPEEERAESLDILSMMVKSSSSGQSIPITEVISGFQTIWRDSQIKRTNRVPTIRAQADPAVGVIVSDLQAKLQAKIEKIELPAEYSLRWEGELGNSTEAQSSLAATIPIGLLAMILTVIFLFNAFRQPLIIWLVVPMALIGVVIGLLVTGASMEFMAILGVLSLSGLLIKNAIVLVDQMDVNIASGQPRYTAVIDGAASRVRPVMMGALTTILGLVPLLMDAFFKAMAVVLIFGLTFATLITLVLVPTLYAILFRISSDEVYQGPNSISPKNDGSEGITL